MRLQRTAGNQAVVGLVARTDMLVQRVFQQAGASADGTYEFVDTDTGDRYVADGSPANRMTVRHAETDEQVVIVYQPASAAWVPEAQANHAAAAAAMLRGGRVRGFAEPAAVRGGRGAAGGRGAGRGAFGAPDLGGGRGFGGGRGGRGGGRGAGAPDVENAPANAYSIDGPARPSKEWIKALKAELTKRHWVATSGANQGSYHLPHEQPPSEPHGFTAGWSKTNYNSSASVATSKPYDEQRVKQAMRWLSTVAAVWLRAKKVTVTEVQATLVDDRIYISANEAGAIAALSQLFKGGAPSSAKLQQLVQEAGQALGAKGRTGRHAKKLRSRLLGDGQGGEWDEVVEALGNPMVVVGRGAKGAHAERRLAAGIGQPLDPARTGGLRRPCVACYIDLFADHDQTVTHSGPLWASANALIGFGVIPAKEMAQRMTELVQATWVNHAGTKIDHSHDTDSDSERDDDHDDDDALTVSSSGDDFDDDGGDDDDDDDGWD